MRAESKESSIAKLCRRFGVARSSFYYKPETPGEPVMDAVVCGVIRGVIEENPAYGVPLITALGGES